MEGRDSFSLGSQSIIEEVRAGSEAEWVLISEDEGGLRDNTHAGHKSLLMHHVLKFHPNLKAQRRSHPDTNLLFVSGIGDESSAPPFFKITA